MCKILFRKLWENKKMGYLFFLICFLIPTQIFADSVNTADTVFSNSLFNFLVFVALILLCIILGLAETVRSLGRYRAESDVIENKKEHFNKTLFIAFLLMCFEHNQLFAQGGSSVPVSANSYAGLDSFTFYILVFLISFEILVITVLYTIIMKLVKDQKESEQQLSVGILKIPVLDKLNDSIALEKEKEIMFDHEYDGIRELDNNLPPWWKYGFYLTIIWAFVYFIHFQGIHTGKLQIEEYEDQMVQAQKDLEEYKKKAANLVDETNVNLLTDKIALNSGQAIYKENCGACHGQYGEGGVGPNLTDDYWLHGGNVKDVFKSIKYGWPEKGMKSWQQDFSAKQIHELSSFIKSLKGTHPLNPKEKQGDLYIESDSITPVQSYVDSIEVLSAHL